MIPCDTVRPQLNALTDGELNVWAAFRIRRHLSACAGCRTEYDAIQRLTEQTRAWCSISTPAHLQTRIADALSTRSESQEDITMIGSKALALPQQKPRPLR